MGNWLRQRNSWPAVAALSQPHPEVIRARKRAEIRTAQEPHLCQPRRHGFAGRPLSPVGPGPFPVIINVHGGYWRRGSRDTFRYWGPYLAERGYAGFTISYRLTKPGKKTYPEVVHDIRAAVQFMRGEAKQFRLDPARIALWGNSAGAHLAALVALAGDYPPFGGGYPDDPHAGVSTRVKLLIGVYGIYELLAQ